MRFEGGAEKEVALECHIEMMCFKGKTWSSEQEENIQETEIRIQRHRTGVPGKTSRVREKEEWRDRNRVQGTGRGFWERKKKSKGQEWCQRFRTQGTGKGPKAQKRGSRDRRWNKRQKEGLRDGVSERAGY